MGSEVEIYHEKQSRELCGLHALNNLFQSESAFSVTDLNNICYSLSPGTWINPHKSSIGLGNYDVNVITAALNTKEYDLVWFDKRKDPRTVNLQQIKGCILNVPNDWKIGFVTLPFNRKHWIAFKKIQENWYNLDSKLKLPVNLGCDEDFYKYLDSQLRDGSRELFLVTTADVSQSECWKTENTMI